MAADFSFDGMIRYFEMAHKVLGWTSTENSYEHHVVQMLKKLRDERDEARREICHDESYNHKSGVTPREVAEDRGWDCFKSNGE